jgi:hypothetical protein
MRCALLVGLATFVVTSLSPVEAQVAPPPAPEFKWPDFATVTKDMQVMPGLVTLYHYKSDDPTKDHTRLLCQVPRSLLKQDLLLVTSYSRGLNAGFPGEDYLIRFELLGKQVVIAAPDTRFVATPGQTATDVIGRTYNDTYLAAMPIVTMSPTGDPVVDLGAVLIGPGMGVAIGGMGIRRDLSQFNKVKAFPDNALIDVDLVMANRSGGGQSVGITYDIRRLPAAGAYSPRVADERVGYFTTVRQDWNIKHAQRENIVRYIDRWDLKKKDATLELSPPDHPIVFIIEKTVPLQWRKYVGEGIAEWNKAYEKLGIVGGIVVQQQTDDNEFANMDPEDARYNFIRWIVTGNAFAMGPHHADPRTGQILDADIIFDDSMLRFYHEDFDIFGPKTMATLLGPDLPEFLLANPAFIPPGHTIEDVRAAAQTTQGELLLDNSANSAAASRRTGPLHAHAACNYAAGMKHQLAVANLAVLATGKAIPEKFIGDIIREIVAHEVGHTLGLRHNFKASAWLSLDEIKRRRDSTDEPTVASVMDYNPVLFFPGDDLSKLRHFITPVIGPYDYFAIEYGYKTPGKDDGDEKSMLAKIASQNTKREFAYSTDEDTMGLASPDPSSNRFDMSNDPVAWAKMRIALCDPLLKDLKKWAVKKDEPNHYMRQAFGTLMSERTRNMTFVTRLVGGQSFNRNRSGDPDAKPPLMLLDPTRQRAALAMLADTVFRDDFVKVDPELLNELPPSRWWDWTGSPVARVDFPIHQMISSMQSSALFGLCSPQVLQRIYDAELKSSSDDKFTAAELISSVRNIIWNNLTIPDDSKYTDAKPMLSSIRRNLQKQHLQYLLAMADTPSTTLISPDLQSMVRFALRELSVQIGGVLEKARSGANGSRLDFASRAHLTECRSQIDRILNAPHIRVPEQRIMILGAEAQPAARQEPQE